MEIGHQSPDPHPPIPEPRDPQIDNCLPCPDNPRMVNVTSRWHILIFIFLALMAAGCRPEQEETTPTPFGTWSPVGDSRPVTVELAEVIESPDSYEGAYIQLSGQYQRLPLLVCGSDAHPSPATWQLTTADGTILVSGRESELRRLIPDGLWMTVTGRMTYFEGAVGCGKRAKLQEMWVLDVDQVVSPNPIARVTLTPGEPSVAGVTPVEGGTISFPETAVSPTPQLAFPTATPVPTGTPILMATSTPLPLTPAFTATADRSDDEEEATATPTATGSDEDDEKEDEEATAEATSSSTAIAITPTTSGSSTAVPTIDVNDVVTVDKGNLISEEILYGDLNSDEQHSWSINSSGTDTLVAYAVGDSQLDVVITVLNGLTGDVLATKNDGGVGETESLTLSVIAGQYDVIVSAVGGNNGRYSALYTLDDASINMTMLGLLTYGQTESGALLVDNDHYWVFEGEQGDEININATPTGSTDLMIELLDHTDFIDANGSGGAEEITFTLPSDGLYILYVTEVNFETAVYAITITKTN